MIRFRVLPVLVTLAAFAGVAPARAEWVITPPRAGQVGLSVQGQYGMLLESGKVGSDFSDGPGLAVRLRYRMRYERGLGLSFESQRFNVRVPTLPDTAAHHMNAFTYGFDVYQMFSTRTRTTKWLSVGMGLAQFRRVLNDQEIDFSDNPDGFYVSGGLGAERFVWRSWAIDLSGRYQALFQDGEVNHDFQAALGLIVYATY